MSVLSSIVGRCPERQRGRTVNPLAIAFEGSSPSWPTGIRNQETVLSVLEFAHVAQAAEHILGKNEVMGSSPIVGSFAVLQIYNFILFKVIKH